MNSRELPFREIDGSSFLVLPKGPAGGCQAEPMVLRAWNRAGRAGRRGAPRRKIKALAGVKHHVGSTECPSEPGDVVPRDEGSRLWRG